MGRKVSEVLFVYSEQQIQEENAVLNPLGKQFIPGEVFVGNASKKYTKMATSEEFDGIRSKYPDSRIIFKGDRFKVKFIPPTTDMAIVK